MRLRRALLGFLAVTLVYLATLFWADSKNHVFYGITQIGFVLAFVAIVSLISYCIRFARWHYLLCRAGFGIGVTRGVFSYMAGFAFTATPGKVGELVRIRYLVPLGVPPEVTLSAFIFERAIDLVAVLALASLFVHQSDIFLYVAGFAVGAIALLLLLLRSAYLTKGLSSRMRAAGAVRVSRLLNSLSKGLVGCRIWYTQRDFAVSLALGLLAWGITAASFVYLCRNLGMVGLPMLEGMSIYPTAMLAGAASMIPGGMGSTEATIVVMLMSMDATILLPTAALAAVGIRLATLWLSIVIGLISIFCLECKALRV